MPFCWRTSYFGEVHIGVVRRLLNIDLPYSYFGFDLFRGIEGETFLGCISRLETYALG